MIAFDTPIGSGTGRIGVVRPDGSGMRWLLTDGANQYDVLRPGSWAPDGSALVFSRFVINPGGSVPSDVFVLTLGDGGVYQLTDDGSSEYPSWSPDGAQIAFDAGASASHQIYAIGVDGTGKARLTNDTADDTNAVWTG
jgi:Tol biopolymer transport system component